MGLRHRFSWRANKCSSYTVFTCSSSAVLNDASKTSQITPSTSMWGTRSVSAKAKGQYILLESKRFFTLHRFSLNAHFLTHVGWDFANETLRLLSLCANEREDGAAYGTQMKEKKSIMSWTVTKWSKGRGLLFGEDRWILRTTHAMSPATAERYPWLCSFESAKIL